MTLPLRHEPGHEAGKRRHHFHGGLRLKHNKKISCEFAVERPPLPALLVVPLLQHAGDAARPLVKEGQQVLKGQPIGQCQPCAAIHSPVSGVVQAVENRPMSHPSGQLGPCVIIKPDGLEKWADLHPVKDWRKADSQTLIRQIQSCGIAGLGGAVFPTHAKTQDGLDRQVHTLIINGVECEPYISCDEMLMREQPDSIILGSAILCRALGAERVVIAIEDQMGVVEKALNLSIERGNCANMTIVKVPSIYPEGGERQLIQVLTGREVPIGGRPSNLGMVCQNVATAAAVAAAVVEGKPLIERYVTVTGNGISAPRNFNALIGTSFSHLVSCCGGYTGDVTRLLVGGPMMGYPVSSDAAPVIKASNCVLALTKQDVAESQVEMPCIRCGECARVCPALLLPQQLHLQIKNNLWKQASEYGLSACIECGCCDLVCPSHIPLVEWFRFGKSEQRKRVLEIQAAELARNRFEQRQARLARLKQERAEKMTRRKQALKNKVLQKDRIRASIDRAKIKAGGNHDLTESTRTGGNIDDA